MKLRFTDMIFTAMTIGLLAAGWAGATCYESSGDGKLLAGRMADFMPRIIESYETGVPQGAVYAVQEPGGYYFKICDEPDQVTYFMRKWAEGAVPGGAWAPLYTTGNTAEIARQIQDGVYLIKFDGTNWAVWQYAAAKAEPAAKSRLYIQTTPAGAGIRVLNIKPRFSQGMEVDPGRYQIETAAKNYRTDTRWIEVKPGEDATLTIALKPAKAK
ncbi:hypothetical protein [Desulfococcus sp.]|uniref:hypothetical protein n=1 Tax=Desulfococcus sp. TaxID=2025834 RepID=UPI0035932A6F